MAIITEYVDIKLKKSTVDWYRSRGYVCESPNVIKVAVKDTMKNASGTIIIECDYCKKHFDRTISNHNSSIKKGGKDACKACSWKKREMANNQEKVYKGGGTTNLTEKDLVEAWGRFNLEIVDDLSKLKNFKTKFKTICKTHPESGVFDKTFACVRKAKHCCAEGVRVSNINKTRKNPQKVRETFVKYGVEPMFEDEDYVNSVTPLPFVCPDHRNKGIQFRTEWNVINSKYKCLHCRDIGKRKYPDMDTEISTPFKLYLRSCTYIWRNKCQKECQYKCVLTGAKKYEVHHLLSFETILQESLSELGIKKETLIDDVLLKNLSQLLKDKHEEVRGVCLRPDVHDLFHNIYGRDGNTEDQFIEFSKRFKEGEFDGRIPG